MLFRSIYGDTDSCYFSAYTTLQKDINGGSIPWTKETVVALYDQIGEEVRGLANTRNLDVNVLFYEAANGESFSNTYLGINDIIAYKVDGNNIYIRGTSDTNLMNANLVPGVTLVSNSSFSLVKIKRISDKIVNVANGIVVTANTSEVVLYQIQGNCIPGT